MVKNPPGNADVRAGSIHGLGRSPGGGHGNPLQYSFWKIPWTEESGVIDGTPNAIIFNAKSGTLNPGEKNGLSLAKLN